MNGMALCALVVSERSQKMRARWLLCGPAVLLLNSLFGAYAAASEVHLHMSKDAWFGISRDVCEYAAKRTPGRWWNLYASAESSALDGALTGIDCQMNETGTHLFSYVTVDICELAPAVIRARAALVEAGAAVPQGCEQGASHAAEIRIPDLKAKFDEVCRQSMPPDGDRQVCSDMKTELVYYERVLKDGYP